MKSKEMNVVEALEKIRGMETLDELAEFISPDEDRKTVRAAFEERAGRIKADNAPPPAKDPKNPPDHLRFISPIFPYDTTIYCETEEPKTLKAGEPIPEGWTTAPGTLKTLWKNKPDGSWFKASRE